MHRAARTILLTAALGSSGVLAAPTTSDTSDVAQPAAQEVRIEPMGTGTADGSTGSRTIDLLIDMQQRSAGLQFNERQRPAGSAEIKPKVRPDASVATTPAMLPASAPRVEPLPTPPSGLFGSGAAPMVHAARTATVDTRGAPGLDAAPQRRSGATPDGGSLPRWLLLPREVIEYVRENRWLVLSSVAGGLLVLWGISALFARAAANAGHVSGPPSDRVINADRWGSVHREVRPARRRSRQRPE